MSKKKNNSCTSFVLVCYEDSMPQSIESIIEIFKPILLRYAYIKHDLDENDDESLKKTHYHVYLKLGARVRYSTIAKNFGISEEQVEYCAFERGTIRYFLHFDDADKTPYAVSQLVSYNIPINDYLDDNVIDKQDRERGELSLLINYVVYKGCFDALSLLNYAIENNLCNTMKKYYSILRDIQSQKWSRSQV